MEDYDDQPSMFDYRTLQAVVREPRIKHELYGSNLSQYIEKRSRSVLSEEDKRTDRIRFWMDDTLRAFIPTLANRRGLTTYSYLAYLLELGQVHFHPDFCEVYEEIESSIDYMNLNARNRYHGSAILNATDQYVSMDVCARKSKSFYPSIPKWLGDDIRVTSNRIHASASDVAYLYVTYGILCSEDQDIPEYYRNSMSDVMHEFQRKFLMLRGAIRSARVAFESPEQDAKDNYMTFGKQETE